MTVHELRREICVVLLLFCDKAKSLNSLHADYAISLGKSIGGIFCTCTSSRHAFRKRVWLLSVRQNTIEMTTLQQRKLFKVTSENKQTTDGASGYCCDWILSHYRPWLGLQENLVHLFYYSTPLFYYSTTTYERYLLHTGHEWTAVVSACNGIVLTKQSTV